jgi:cobalt-precorrin 5A hydrolase
MALICFTERGFQTEKRLAGLLAAWGAKPRLFVLGKYALQAAAMDHTVSFCPVKEGGLSKWTDGQWEADALIFVGACGIAVRAIAPLIKDKYTDPAVLVVDEAAGFVIPILSGHMGGANELAVRLAEAISAIPVITTATDRNGRFAVDVFARSHGLVIDDRVLAKAVSADVLAGEPVGFFCDFPLDGEAPKELSCDTICRHNIWVTVSKRERTESGTGRVLKLIPRCVTVGIGCRRGTSREKLREILTAAMEENHVDGRSVCALASIDLKQGEPGICMLAGELGIPFLTYTGEELLNVPGRFSESEFVRQTTGVGNVCERAAMAACLEVSKSSRSLFGKFAKDGVTVATACFYPELFKDGDRKEAP